MHQTVVTPEVLARHILPLLPQDGTPVLNRVMRVMLSRQLEIQIEPIFISRLATRFSKVAK